jgi:putative PIN family toxin of toxin-antitoxin system
VLVSGVLFEDGNEAQILKSAQKGDIELFISPAILAEFDEVLSRPKFQLSREELSAASEYLLAVTKLVVSMATVKIELRDADDLKVLECSQACGANHIVTGHQDLLTLGKFGKATIVSTATLARQLRLLHPQAKRNKRNPKSS